MLEKLFIIYGVICMLILAGGIGYMEWVDIRDWRRSTRTQKSYRENHSQCDSQSE